MSDEDSSSDGMYSIIGCDCFELKRNVTGLLLTLSLKDTFFFFRCAYRFLCSSISGRCCCCCCCVFENSCCSNFFCCGRRLSFRSSFERLYFMIHPYQHPRREDLTRQNNESEKEKCRRHDNAMYLTP